MSLGIRSVEDFRRALQAIKASGPGFSTTFFAGMSQLEVWLAAGRIEFLLTREGLLIARRDRDFLHLHHLVPEPGALPGLLQALPTAWKDRTLVADLVGRPEDLSRIADGYLGHGFQEHRSLVRMGRTGHPEPRAFRDPSVASAGPEEAGEIVAFLERLLDRFAEQIPEAAEVADWASQGWVLASRADGRLAGVLIFEYQGRSCRLLFWHVDEACRHAGIGSGLIHEFFRLTQGVTRTSLWVMSDNQNSLAMYRHYGFQEENAVDRILIRHPLPEGASI
ncbi:GNAT family N-acetyltransferase [Geothrix paludis]|uniref:GNAT family N-acetyltransferase n=1 Tax=Geothrix paludis TaxID=2922722 RepID=UPI001FAD6053